MSTITEQDLENNYQEVKSKPSEKFERVWKDKREFVHELFKLEVSEFKKDVSFKKYEPKIEQVAHCHWFHNVDKDGRPNKTCAPVGGHWHDVEVSVNKKGELVTKCGPPFRKVDKVIRGKWKSVIEPVFYGTDNLTDPGAIVDNHTHEIKYIHSETIKRK